MQDVIRNIKLLGIGLFYTGKEKIEETVAELIKKGEISEPEGRALVDELVAKSQAAAKDMEKWIRKAMFDVYDNLHAPMKKEIAVQKKRIEKLEKAGAGKSIKSPKKNPKKNPKKSPTKRPTKISKKIPRSPRKPRT